MSNNKNNCQRCGENFEEGFVNNVVKISFDNIEIWRDYYDYIFDNWYKILCSDCLLQIEFLIIFKYNKHTRKTIKMVLEKILKLK